MLAEHFSASRKESFILCWCSIGAIAHSGSGHKRGFSFRNTAKNYNIAVQSHLRNSRMPSKQVETFSGCWETFRHPEKLFGMPKKISASRKNLGLGGFKLVVQSHILREIWQIPWLRMSFKWGVYGEKEVRLGLSRPLDGLACPIKFLPVRIALILAYFGVAGTMYCCIFSVACLFEIPQRSWGITVDIVSPEAA